MRAPQDLSFDVATAVRPTGDPSLFETDIHALWTVGDKPNGGYLLALLGRAAAPPAGATRPDLGGRSPRPSPTCGRPSSGPATVRTTLLRRGRSAAHVRAVLVQDGTDLVDAVFVLGRRSPTAPLRYDGVEPLQVAEPADCVRLPPRTPRPVHVGMLEVIDLRLDPRDAALLRLAAAGAHRPSCAAGPGSPTGASPTRSLSSSPSTPYPRPRS